MSQGANVERKKEVQFSEYTIGIQSHPKMSYQITSSFSYAESTEFLAILSLSQYLSLSITHCKSSRLHPVSTQLMYVSLCWFANTGVTMFESVKEHH